MKNRMKELRKQQKVSQAALARTLGVSRQAINGFESGKFDPSLQMAFKIAHSFDVAIEDVFLHEAQNSMQTLLKRVTDFLGFDFGFEAFSDSSLRVISFARNQAIAQGQKQVEPQHLIEGLLADITTASARLLRKHGAEIEISSDENAFADRERLKLSRSSQFVLEAALQAVRLKEQNLIETEHLLWGLLQLAETDPSVWQQLAGTYQVDVNSLKSEVQNML